MRIAFGQYTRDVWGWPSRGGVIVLDRATVPGHGTPWTRQCRSTHAARSGPGRRRCALPTILLLGAKWFDSTRRCHFVAALAENDESVIEDVRHGEMEIPSLMERRWVSVAYPDGHGPEGGFWVLELESGVFGTPSFFVEDVKRPKLIPDKGAWVHLARTMAEERGILERMGARFYANLDEYDGAACLNAWKDKTEGEFGPLEQTTPIWVGGSN
ncbi:hypothetical protein N0V93_003505 [Gnomoniopsis smithogilvyi]|uniref:Uncharacterized protein n=1 Tax=Gnomoniopsis smithogilvyi TaxID=1191159 RepID=A0A9W9D038_9PEZI|nr:hypothetical protein N0V93_003505 [Gnomoniopsis smithogilvyi]